MLPLVERWPPCPGCHGARLAALHVMKNAKRLVASPWLGVLGCEDCGLAFTAPRPDPAELLAYYDKNESGGWSRQPPDASSPKMARKRAAATTALTRLGMLDGTGRALDFGCGAGAMLDVLQDAGWETCGIEPAQTGEHAARRHQLLANIPATPTFDLLIVNHVLEHLLDPRQLLLALHAAARPGARLLVGVPALDGVAVTGDLPYAVSGVHINAFTAAALANVLRASGWRPAPQPGPAERARLTLSASRSESPLSLQAGCLDAARASLRRYGRRLDIRGEYTVCPLAWPETAGESD